jgi:hypothetical protein
MAIEWLPLAVALTTSLRILVGVSLLIVVPLPNWPELL